MAIKAGEPVKIEGVTVIPKWDWSENYLLHFKRMMRGDRRRQVYIRQARYHVALTETQWTTYYRANRAGKPLPACIVKILERK